MTGWSRARCRRRGSASATQSSSSQNPPSRASARTAGRSQAAGNALGAGGVVARMRYVAVAAAVLACAVPALAKDGVVAHLANPQVLKAAPGTSVVLVWTLRAGAHPFGASGIYVRLHGTRTTAALAEELAPGRYRARLLVPRGGVRSIVIALKAWRSDSRGTTRADWRLPIDN